MQAVVEKLRSDYDYIIIDCLPSLGIVTVNALCAADTVLIPVQCEFFALEGLAKLQETVQLVKKNLNPKLSIEGIVLTMYGAVNYLNLAQEFLTRNKDSQIAATVPV